MIKSKDINDLYMKWMEGSDDPGEIINNMANHAHKLIKERDSAVSESSRRGMIIDAISAAVDSKRIHIERSDGNWSGSKSLQADAYFLKALDWIDKEISLRWTSAESEVHEYLCDKMRSKIKWLKSIEK